LAAASGSSANYFAFSDNMNRYTVTLAFIMADGSERALTVYPAPTPVNSNFTVKSTGRIAGSNIYRTIEAEYNAVIGSIVRYHEINTQIYP
jgi:hypothetical protein